MIGDGMGPQQVGLLALYARYAPHSVVPDRTAAIERLFNEGVLGVMRTECHGAMVVDSAASATQLSNGQFAGSEMIGIDYRGERAEHILEVAHRLGKSGGLVTETRITHATPAGFAAHQQNRNMENEIAVDLMANHPEVMFGGGLRHFVPEAINNRDSAAYAALMQTTGAPYPATSKRFDNRDLLLEARNSYKLVFDRHGLAAVTKGPVLGLFADSEMLDALQERAVASDPKHTQPSLVDMSAKAVEVLNQNPKGFFLMIEGGEIDWAGHNNDAGLLLQEMLQFDDAVRKVYEWVRQRDDTLLIVTADHETGSFGFSYAGRPLPAPTTLPGKAFSGAQFQPNFNYAPPELLDKLYDQRKSFFGMIAEYEALPIEEQKPERLVEIVNA
jgi:alkaline phosphatase